MTSVDRWIVEAASWGLASNLMRRHPKILRVIRAHPGDGQYDLLWLKGADEGGQVDVRLNRVGTIQVDGRADGAGIDWKPAPWGAYLADPWGFTKELERAAGLEAPEHTPAATPVTLTYRFLAALASMTCLTAAPIEITQGFIDSSGDDGGCNESLDRFPVDRALVEPQPDDLFGEPGYRFWIPERGGIPLAAIEQTTATAWFLDGQEPLELTAAYASDYRDPSLVAARVLKRGLASANS